MPSTNRTTKLVTPTPKDSFILGYNIVILAPAYTLSNTLIQTLISEIVPHHHLVESDTYSQDILRASDPPTINLILLNSLKGLSNKPHSHTEKLYYILVNYSRDHL
jgi:hypothetical protein